MIAAKATISPMASKTGLTSSTEVKGVGVPNMPRSRDDEMKPGMDGCYTENVIRYDRDRKFFWKRESHLYIITHICTVLVCAPSMPPVVAYIQQPSNPPMTDSKGEECSPYLPPPFTPPSLPQSLLFVPSFTYRRRSWHGRPRPYNLSARAQTLHYQYS